MQTRGRRRRSGAGAGVGAGAGDGDGNGRIDASLGDTPRGSRSVRSPSPRRLDASLGDTPRGSRSVRSPSPRRRAPRVNEDRLLSAEERDRDSVAQILERSQHILNSILSTEEAEAVLDGVELGVEYVNNFSQLLETRGQPVVALVATGFAIASAIGVVISCIVFHTSNAVFHLSIRTLQAIFSSWYKTKLLLISSMLCILVVVGNVLNFSTQFYMGIGCGVLLGVFLI